MENSRRCEICNIDDHRASYAKQLRKKKHLENRRQEEIFIPERLYKEKQTPIRKQSKKVYNPRTLKQIAKKNLKRMIKNWIKK